jgi:LysR family transcriptional regulator, pca operon transcriptional activator
MPPISIMPRLMMLGDLLRGTLRIVPLPIPAPDRPAGLILPRDRTLPPPACVSVQCLRVYIREIVTRGVAPTATSDSGSQKGDTTVAEDEP